MKAATPESTEGGRRGLEQGPVAAGPLMTITREEAIHIVMRRENIRCHCLVAVAREERIHLAMRRGGIQCPRLARRLHMRGIPVEPDTLYRMLKRTVKPGGRGREPHVRAILAETERILGLEVDDGQA